MNVPYNQDLFGTTMDTQAGEIAALRQALRNLLSLIEDSDCCPDHYGVALSEARRVLGEEART